MDDKVKKYGCDYCPRLLMTALIQDGLVEIFCKQCKLLVRFNFKNGVRINPPPKRFGVTSVRIYKNML